MGMRKWRARGIGNVALACAFVCHLIGLQIVPTRAGWLTSLFWDTVEENKSVRHFDELNAELVRSLGPYQNDPAANIRLAELWLREQTTAAANNKVVAQQATRLDRDALLLFTKLSRILQHQDCKMNEFNIIRENMQATGRELMLTRDQVGPLRRIEQVVYQIAVDHADTCRDVYPAKFKEERRNTKPPNRDLYIVKMFEQLIATANTKRLFKGGNRYTEAQLTVEYARDKSLFNKPEALAVLDFVRNQARTHPDKIYLHRIGDPLKRGAYIVDTIKVNQFLNDYAIVACEFVIRRYGRVLKPAREEQQLYDEADRYRAVTSEYAQLMIWLEYHRLCEQMASEGTRKTFEQFIIKLINDGN